MPVGEQGDCFDRFLVRMAEVKQSLRILRQVIDNLPDGPWLADVPLHARPEPGESYARVESPRGELGFYLVSDGGAGAVSLPLPSAVADQSNGAEGNVGWRYPCRCDRDAGFD